MSAVLPHYQNENAAMRHVRTNLHPGKSGEWYGGYRAFLRGLRQHRGKVPTFTPEMQAGFDQAQENAKVQNG